VYVLHPPSRALAWAAQLLANSSDGVADLANNPFHLAFARAQLIGPVVECSWLVQADFALIGLSLFRPASIFLLQSTAPPALVAAVQGEAVQASCLSWED
jgi:hypothetical protein